jgi:hypothetical protein
MITESGACGLDIGRKFRFIEWFFGGRSVFLGNDVVDGLLHGTSFIYKQMKLTIPNQLIQPMIIKTNY